MVEGQKYIPPEGGSFERTCRSISARAALLRSINALTAFIYHNEINQAGTRVLVWPAVARRLSWGLDKTLEPRLLL